MFGFRRKPSFFISHSGRDKAIAICVARLLAQRGLEFWLDLLHVQAPPPEAIYNGIEQTSTFVIIASENYDTTKWCLKEMGAAESKRNRLGKRRCDIVCLRIERPPTSRIYYPQHGGTSTRPESERVDPEREIHEFFVKFAKKPLTEEETEWLSGLFHDGIDVLNSFSAGEIWSFIYGGEQQMDHTGTGFAKPAALVFFILLFFLARFYWFSFPQQEGNTVRESTPMPATAASFLDNRTIAVYICDDKEDELQQHKIHDLYGYFKQNLYIATADSGTRAGWIVPEEQVFSDRILDPSFKCSDACEGMERALMLLIRLANWHKYDRAWVITQDTYWASFDKLRQAAFEDCQGDSTDLLHQNEGMEKRPLWNPEMNHSNFKYLRIPFVQPTAEALPPYYTGLFNFYRISSDMVLRLQDWKFRNKGSGTFYEPILATLSVQASGLTTKSYINEKNRHKFCFDYRPCFQKDDINGTTDRCPRGVAFHPVFKDFGACSA